MADTKITALAAIATVYPAADVLPIVDISDTSMAASGTTQKITSNQILGAGGTATLASATITGALVVDTTTLVVDATNDRVGIGTAGPAVPLQVKKDGVASGAGWTTIGRFHTVAETKGVDLGYNPVNNNAVITALSGGVASGFEFWSFDGSWASRATLNSAGMYISNGNVVMSTSGTGIDFSATTSGSGTMTSELLNDYEEGTWTGTLTGGTTNPTIPVTATGRYTKIGRVVTVTINFNVVITTGASGSVLVTGLPFVNNSSNTAHGALLSDSAMTFTGSPFSFIEITSSTIQFLQSTSNAAANVCTHNAGTGRYIQATITYTV